MVAWLAQQLAKTPIAGMLRIGWDTVGQIVARVVAEICLDPFHAVRLGQRAVDQVRRDE
jgi:transposase